jgi:hypothetical protein
MQIYAQYRDVGLKDGLLYLVDTEGRPAGTWGVENSSEVMFGRKNGDVGEYCGLVGE